jgi:hypothetical protein
LHKEIGTTLYNSVATIQFSSVVQFIVSIPFEVAQKDALSLQFTVPIILIIGHSSLDICHLSLDQFLNE